jgi:hypothetical protein
MQCGYGLAGVSPVSPQAYYSRVEQACASLLDAADVVVDVTTKVTSKVTSTVTTCGNNSDLTRVVGVSTWLVNVNINVTEVVNGR